MGSKHRLNIYSGSAVVVVVKKWRSDVPLMVQDLGSADHPSFEEVQLIRAIQLARYELELGSASCQRPIEADRKLHWQKCHQLSR